MRRRRAKRDPSTEGILSRRFALCLGFVTPFIGSSPRRRSGEITRFRQSTLHVHLQNDAVPFLLIYTSSPQGAVCHLFCSLNPPIVRTGDSKTVMTEPETVKTENGGPEASEHPARIQVSLGKKPLYFYVNLAKKLLAEHGEVQLSALGFAMSNMVSVAEILKKEGMVEEKKLSTCIDTLTDRGRPRPVRKPKMEVILIKSADFDQKFAEQQKNREARAAEKAAAEAAEAAQAADTNITPTPAPAPTPTPAPAPAPATETKA